jgi:lipid II:glycine glycyltransferase (peptidoglycan interpeptide bridge formation enzyme)
VEDETARWLVTRPTDRQAWDVLLAEVPTADPLQSWSWSEAGVATGERWDRLIATDADGRPVAAVQWQLVSPVLGHPLAYAPHGPVWRRDDPGAASGALPALVAGMRREADAARASAILVDPRRGSPGTADPDPLVALGQLGFAGTPRHVQMPSTRVLGLGGGVSAAREGWDKDTRNLVRRAAREGVEVGCGPADEAAVEALHGLMQAVGSRGSFAPRSRAFLAAYGRSSGDRAFACLGRWQGRVIAGALVGLVGDRAYYQFAGSLREPELRHANAAYAVMDSVIGACVERGARSLDLCGVNERDDPDADPRWEGLSSFKRGFGGEPVRHPPVCTMLLRPGIERVRGMAQRARRLLRG